MGIFLKDINLKGKTALITGATKGLGRGAAIAIAEAGGNIIAIGRNQLELNTLKKEVKKFKVNYMPFNCDVNNYTSISEIMLVNQFDYVFHYAAVVGVNRTQENPIMVLNDIQGIKNVLQLSKNFR